MNKSPDGRQIRENLALVAEDVGRTVPHLRLADAVGYRIRRNYGYLLLVILVLALRAPSEGMLNWTAVPTPAERLFSGPRRWLRRRPGPEAES